jgi:hypothetical protein
MKIEGRIPASVSAAWLNENAAVMVFGEKKFKRNLGHSILTKAGLC